MRAFWIILCLLPLLPTTTLANDIFKDVRVKVGKRTCTCSFSLNPDASVKDSKGSCDKKCSGSASGVQLEGLETIFTISFLVRKRRVAFKSIEIQDPPPTSPPTGITPPTIPTIPTTIPTAGTLPIGATHSVPGSIIFSCPPGFRSVCSMLGSCRLGTYSMCPPGHQESGVARPPSPSDCRCVPFFLLEQLYEATTGSKERQSLPDESRSILDRKSVQNQEQFEEDVEAQVGLRSPCRQSNCRPVGKRTCSCRFTIIIIVIREDGVLIVIVKVSAKSQATCDKKCSGAAKNVEITGESGITYSFGLSVKKGKARMSSITAKLGQSPTPPQGETPVLMGETPVLMGETPVLMGETPVLMETPISTQPPTITSLPPTGCLCVDKDNGV